MTKKIMLDAGHGLPTPARRTLNQGAQEWTLNDIVARQVAENLRDYDVEIQRSDDVTGRTDASLATRQTRINRFAPDALVSIHHNAFKGVWGNHGGVETFIRNSPSSDSTMLASLIQGNMAENIGLRNRGVKNMNWAVLMVNANIPAILTESGFMDSRTDVPVIESRNGQLAYAKAISDGLIAFLNLRKGSATTHVVKAGQTLWSISQQHNTTVDALKEANNLNSNHIIVGQVLRLPSSSGNISTGQRLNLSNVPLFANSTTSVVSRQMNGNFFVWNRDIVNGRIRITNSADRVNVNGQVTGWINVSDI